MVQFFSFWFSLWFLVMAFLEFWFLLFFLEEKVELMIYMIITTFSSSVLAF